MGKSPRGVDCILLATRKIPKCLESLFVRCVAQRKMFREYKDVLAPIPGRLHSKVKDLRLNRTIIARRIKTRYPSIFHPIDPSTIIFIHP